MSKPNPFELYVIENVVRDIKHELLDTTRNSDAFNSAHEGYAVIKQELDT